MVHNAHDAFGERIPCGHDEGPGVGDDGDHDEGHGVGDDGGQLENIFVGICLWAITIICLQHSNNPMQRASVH